MRLPKLHWSKEHTQEPRRNYTYFRGFWLVKSLVCLLHSGQFYLCYFKMIASYHKVYYVCPSLFCIGIWDGKTSHIRLNIMDVRFGSARNWKFRRRASSISVDSRFFTAIYQKPSSCGSSITKLVFFPFRSILLLYSQTSYARPQLLLHHFIPGR